MNQEEGKRIWTSLHGELSEAGIFRATSFETCLRLVTLTICLAAGFALAWNDHFLAGTILLALVMAQFAFLGHDSAHGALTSDQRISKGLGQFCMTVVTGLCYEEWRSRHLDHHRLCQHEATDPDIGEFFVASLTFGTAKKKKGLAVFFTRIQAYTLWAITLVFGHSQRIFGQLGAFQNPRQYSMDLLSLVFHYAVWIGFPVFALELSWSLVLAVYLVPLFFLGPYLAAIFWVNHLGMPLVDEAAKFSFFEHQVRTTRNVRPLPGTAWLYGGLCHQIEHHLFPTVPSYRLGKAKEIVKVRVGETGMEYHERAWSSAIADVGRHFQQVARSI